MFKVRRKFPLCHHKCLRSLGIHIMSGAALLEYPAAYLACLDGSDIENALGSERPQRIYRVHWPRI